MKKIVLFVLLLIFSGSNAVAQLKLSVKIRTFKPLMLSLSDINGKLILQKQIKSGELATFDPTDIGTDYLILKIGEYEQNVIFENNEVTIKGLVDDKNHKNVVLQFDGAPLTDSLIIAEKLFKTGGQSGWNWGLVKDRFHPAVLAAIVYRNELYFTNKGDVLNSIKGAFKNGEIYGQISSWISEKARLADMFREGAEIASFSLPDKNGKIYSTDDFKDKFILLDFWASWCAPCRAEMKSLQKIHEEIQGDDLVFISISLDDSREKWLNAMEKDNIPWLALWDSSGFEKTPFQKQFGFSQIPFIILISKDGKILARNLRGENVKNEILKYRNNL